MPLPFFVLRGGHPTRSRDRVHTDPQVRGLVPRTLRALLLFSP